MSNKTVYISYHPSQSLHVAQPLFNELHKLNYDVFMDINEGIDNVNLRQIAAREHFLMILTPGALKEINNKNDRLAVEFRVALKHKRNIILLLTKDFDFHTELGTDPEGILSVLTKMPSLRLQPKQLKDTTQLLSNKYLTQQAAAKSIELSPEDIENGNAKIQEAREYAQQATIRLNTERQFFQAVVKIRQGDFDGALSALDMVIGDNPNNESAYLQRGRVLRKKGRKTAALRDFETATRLSPKLVAAHIGLGELLLETGRPQRAQEVFATALELQRESAPAIAGMALTQHILDHTDEALKLWGWLIDRDENYADARWAGEVFDWDDELIARAADLLIKL